jgi:hypothetical protein
MYVSRGPPLLTINKSTVRVSFEENPIYNTNFFNNHVVRNEINIQVTGDPRASLTEMHTVYLNKN